MIGPFMFLDFDGVLNHHKPHSNKYCGTCPDCVAVCNSLLDSTKAKIVVASAWRYFVLRGEMTVQGLGGLMCTHGLAWGSIVDVLGPEETLEASRGRLVLKWFRDKFGALDTARYVIIDDLDLGYSDLGLPYFQTKGDAGLCGCSQSQLDRIELALLGASS